MKINSSNLFKFGTPLKIIGLNKIIKLILLIATIKKITNHDEQHEKGTDKDSKSCSYREFLVHYSNQQSCGRGLRQMLQWNSSNGHMRLYCDKKWIDHK